MRIPREDVIIRVVQRDDNDDEGENSVAPPRTPSDDTIYVKSNARHRGFTIRPKRTRSRQRKVEKQNQQKKENHLAQQ